MGILQSTASKPSEEQLLNEKELEQEGSCKMCYRPQQDTSSTLEVALGVPQRLV